MLRITHVHRPSYNLPITSRRVAARIACSTAASAAPAGASSSSTGASSASAVATAGDVAVQDAYSQLAKLAAATGPVSVGETLRGRGLVTSQWLDQRTVLVAVPLSNALVIADDPTGGISIFSDRHHRQFQEVHGPMPPALLEFLQGEARWDARMAAWLLFIIMRPPSPVWRQYLSLLPAERDMTCLLNFSEPEASELQLPWLMEEARVQAAWNAHLHAKFYDSRTGTLGQVGLSTRLRDSLWALSLVRSRTFSEDVNGESLTLMVPYVDLANHCTKHNSTFCLSRDNTSLQLRSLFPIDAGEEVLISYGAEKPNCELLRDYGFVLPGNVHDRITFTASGSSSSSSKEGGRQGAAAGSKGKLLGLNPACLLEAAGFKGDLGKGDITPLAEGGSTGEQLRRREAALLSMPLHEPGSSSGSDGGIFGWLTSAAQPWTESGRPPPQPLRREQATAEHAAVQRLQALVAQQLAGLPTSIDTDQQLLAQAEAEGRPAGSGSRGGGGTVQQRRQARLALDGSRHATEQLAAAQQGGGVVLSSPRVQTAIRARLEHKLLLREAAGVLQQYQEYLAARFGA